MDCRELCSGYCTNNEPCNHVSGICPSGCQDGYMESYCNKSNYSHLFCSIGLTCELVLYLHKRSNLGQRSMFLVKPGTVVELKELSFVIYFNKIVCFQRFFYGFVLLLASPVSNGKPSFSFIVFFFKLLLLGSSVSENDPLVILWSFFFIRVFCFQQKTLSLF